MASPQIETLRNVIASAQAGSEHAIDLLREICESAVVAAPVADLITIGHCLVSIGIEAEKIERGRN